MRKPFTLLLAAVLAMALTATALAAARPVKHAKLDVDGFSFKPATLHVKKGTKVVWKWVDGSDIGHNIWVRRGPVKFHSRTMHSGTYSHVFTKAGTYFLYCRIHPWMTEKVVVK